MQAFNATHEHPLAPPMEGGRKDNGHKTQMCKIIAFHDEMALFVLLQMKFIQRIPMVDCVGGSHFAIAILCN